MRLALLTVILTVSLTPFARGDEVTDVQIFQFADAKSNRASAAESHLPYFPRTAAIL